METNPLPKQDQTTNKEAKIKVIYLQIKYTQVTFEILTRKSSGPLHETIVIHRKVNKVVSRAYKIKF